MNGLFVATQYKNCGCLCLLKTFYSFFVCICQDFEARLEDSVCSKSRQIDSNISCVVKLYENKKKEEEQKKT